VKVERMDLARSVVATGRIEPVTKVEIKSKASGIILKLPVNVGDRVHQGQVICELDQNDLLPRTRQAQAALGMAEASLKSARAEFERAKVEAEGPDLPSSNATGARARNVPPQVAPQMARDEAEKNYETAKNRQHVAMVSWECPKPPFVRRKRRSSKPAPNLRLPKKTSAMPPSFRRSTASSCRAIAKWVTPSAPS
jgi:pyruvate/2-oxoglutarate dehydrogenase complex dihydrolipoamide acyltransferase (E2) component